MPKLLLTHDEIMETLHKDVTRLGSQLALAKVLGIQAPYMHDMLRGKRYPSKKVLEHYGWVKVTAFDVAAPRPEVRAGEAG